jgi:hypothetical protein
LRLKLRGSRAERPPSIKHLALSNQ